MEFVEYLTRRHLFTSKERGMKEISAKQYANRFENLVRNRIYNGETEMNADIVEKINKEYVNKTNEYERTLKYYLEYRRHVERAANHMESRSE